MPRSQPLDRWTDQVRMAFPNLSRPQATVLALYSFGMILAHRCGLSSVVTALVPVLGLSSSFANFTAMRFANVYQNPLGSIRCFRASFPGACWGIDVGFRAGNRHTVWC